MLDEPHSILREFLIIRPNITGRFKWLRHSWGSITMHGQPGHEKKKKVEKKRDEKSDKLHEVKLFRILF